MNARKAPPPKTVRRLSIGDSYKLIEMVRLRYAESGLTDVSFAEMASEELGTSVSESSVSTARQVLDLPNNRDKPSDDPIERLRAIEQVIENCQGLRARVEELEKWRKLREGE